MAKRKATKNPTAKANHVTKKMPNALSDEAKVCAKSETSAEAKVCAKSETSAEATPNTSGSLPLYPLLIVIAGVMWGMLSIFSTELGKYGLVSLEISGIRCFVAAPILAVVLLVRDKRLFRINARDLWIFACGGILSFLMFGFLYFECIQLSEVSVAVILLYTSPIWLILLGAALFKEKITKNKLCALVLTVSGCTLVSGVLGGTGAITPLAALCGCGSGLAYALYSVFGTLAMRKYSALTYAFYVFLFAALAGLIVCNPAHIFYVVSAQPAALLPCAGLGILCTVIPFLLYTIGLAHTQASRAGILATAEPLVSCIVGVGYFGEDLNVAKVAGITLVLAALIIASLGKEEKTATKN